MCFDHLGAMLSRKFRAALIFIPASPSKPFFRRRQAVDHAGMVSELLVPHWAMRTSVKTSSDADAKDGAR